MGKKVWFMRSNRRRLAVLLAIGAVVGAAFAMSAGATQFVAGKLIINFHFDFRPETLPKVKRAPIEFFGDAKLKMKDGSYPPVPTFIEAEFDKEGILNTEGLPVCPKGRLEATTTQQARKACPASIIGTGFGEGVVIFPEQAPIEVSSPITFFNGPEIGGNPTAISHFYLTVPTPTAILVVIKIERIHKLNFGTRIEATIPKIAGGAGSATGFRFKLGHRWTYKGKEMSYLSARCIRSGVYRIARGKVTFDDGTLLGGSVFAGCKTRKE